jgi:hypothetical protein
MVSLWATGLLFTDLNIEEGSKRYQQTVLVPIKKYNIKRNAGIEYLLLSGT